MEGYIQAKGGSNEWHYGFFSEWTGPDTEGIPRKWADFNKWIRDTHKTTFGNADEIRKKAEEIGKVTMFQEPGENGRICFGVFSDDKAS